MSQSITTILATLMPVLLFVSGGLGWLYKQEREKRREMEKRLNDKKASIYESYITNITSLFHKENQQEIKAGSVSEKRILEIIKKMNEFHKFVLVYGSKDIIRTQSEYMSFTYSNGKYGKKFDSGEISAIKNHFFYLTKIINVMRKELGHSPESISMDELGRLFITDYVPGAFGE